MKEPVKKPPASKRKALKKRQLSPKQKKLNNFALGQKGEDQAARYLQQRGYQLLAQNLTYGRAELDLVAFDPKQQELAFIEVKTRRSSQFGSPHHAVTHHKFNQMYYVARAYLKKHPSPHNFRFDIITVVSGTIRHYRHVTWP